MRLLLDTHTFLWFVDPSPRLSRRAEALICDPLNMKLVSMASCWEIAIKSGLGKLRLGEPAATFLPKQLAANGFKLLRIRLRHVLRVESLPHHHRDPFDRLLAAQALAGNLPIVSADPAHDAYGVRRLW